VDTAYVALTSATKVLKGGTNMDEIRALNVEKGLKGMTVLRSDTGTRWAKSLTPLFTRLKGN
jgi:hypothetical protein